MKNLLSLLLLLVIAATARAQVFQVSGYLKEMHSFYFLQNEVPLPNGDSTKFTYYNLMHNRLNFTIRPFKGFQIDIGMRNRLMDGGLIRQVPQYGDLLSQDDGLLDLSWNIFNKGGWVFNTSFDRFLIDYSWGNFQVKLGRQRINWGVSLVWNPNDIFNAFSYIDFDYEERPGSDAAMFTWYSSATSSLDAVFKIDGDYSTTIAARYLFNVKNYDLQFIAGKCSKDIVAGMGWTGGIKNVAFRGEATLFVPVIDRKTNSDIVVSATIEADYTFRNSLYLHGAFLFNSAGTLKREGGISLLALSSDLSAKKLSLGMFEIFGQLTYPVNPIFNIGFSTMFNPADLSAYVSPTATLSLHDDVELMFAGQFLFGKTGSEYGANGNTYAAFVRLRWSFEKSVLKN